MNELSKTNTKKTMSTRTHSLLTHMEDPKAVRKVPVRTKAVRTSVRLWAMAA